MAVLTNFLPSTTAGYAGIHKKLRTRGSKPLTTSALTPEYRKEMIRVLAKRALFSAAQ